MRDRLEELWYWLLECTICRWRGHKIVDCSSAGPESGNMDHYCSRCLHHWDVTLY